MDKIRSKYLLILFSLFILLSVPTLFLHSSEASIAESSIFNLSNETKNMTLYCSMLANQHIVFADMHIIQAIRDLADWNKTGALDQLTLAQQQLEDGLEQQQC